jgi:hypothetical protein
MAARAAASGTPLGAATALSPRDASPFALRCGGDLMRIRAEEAAEKAAEKAAAQARHTCPTRREKTQDAKRHSRAADARALALCRALPQARGVAMKQTFSSARSALPPRVRPAPRKACALPLMR